MATSASRLGTHAPVRELDEEFVAVATTFCELEALDNVLCEDEELCEDCEANDDESRTGAEEETGVGVDVVEVEAVGVNADGGVSFRFLSGEDGALAFDPLGGESV